MVLADAGAYRCEAENSLNKTSASGILLVRRKTVIEQAPSDLEVYAGSDAKFTCSGTTDPEEVGTIMIISIVIIINGSSIAQIFLFKKIHAFVHIHTNEQRQRERERERERERHT